MEQRSQTWFDARRGMLTASQFRRVMHGSPRGLASLALSLRAQLRGGTTPSFTAAATDWGNTHEAQARALFELECGLIVDDCGLLIHPQHFFIGASPDGLIGARAGLEIKCPANPENHQHVLAHGMPERHIPQVQGSLWVSGRATWYFVSFDPRLLATLDFRRALYVERVERDDRYIAKLERKVLQFWREHIEGQPPAAAADDLPPMLFPVQSKEVV